MLPSGFQSLHSIAKAAVLICCRDCGPAGVLGTGDDACLAIGLNRRASRKRWRDLMLSLMKSLCYSCPSYFLTSLRSLPNRCKIQHTHLFGHLSCSDPAAAVFCLCSNCCPSFVCRQSDAAGALFVKTRPRRLTSDHRTARCSVAQPLTFQQSEWLKSAADLGILLAPDMLRIAFETMDSTGVSPC